MHSEIRVKTDNLKLYLSLGICATVVVIFLAVWFRFEFSVMLLSVSGVILVSGGLGVWGKFEAIRHNRQVSQLQRGILEQDLRIKIAEADRAEAGAGVLNFPRTDRLFVLPGREGMRFIEAVAGGNGEIGQPLALPAGAIDLLPIMFRTRRALIYGASEAGKTTLLRHIAHNAKNVVMVDPHFEPGKWPACRAIGAGRNFDEIAAFLAWLETELQKRSEQMATGNTDFEPMTIIIDELSTIVMHCGKEAVRPLASMIMESNKFGFRVFVGGHSKLVELLGLKGMGDVREGLITVHLRYNQETEQREYTVNSGNGERPCTFPPFYNYSSDGEQAIVKIPDLVFTPNLTPKQREIQERRARIAEMVEAEASNNEIAQEVYGKPRLVGAAFNEVQDIRNAIITGDSGRF